MTVEPFFLTVSAFALSFSLVLFQYVRRLNRT